MHLVLRQARSMTPGSGRVPMSRPPSAHRHHCCKRHCCCSAQGVHVAAIGDRRIKDDLCAERTAANEVKKEHALFEVCFQASGPRRARTHTSHVIYHLRLCSRQSQQGAHASDASM